MKCKIQIQRYVVLLMLTSFLISSLIGCRRQVIEKVGVLPDRPTQFIAHNAETETTAQESKSWDVQNVNELRLFTTEMEITEEPSVHYYNNSAYLYRTVRPDSSQIQYSLEMIEADGSLTPLHSLTLSADNECVYCPTGTAAAYITQIDGCLTLMLMDLLSNEQSIIWQSDETSLLKDLGLSVKLHCQWSADGNSLLFIPICYTDPESETLSGDSTAPTEESSADTAESTMESSVTTIQDSSADTVSVEESSTETIDLRSLSSTEKMQLVYEALPNLPFIYIYQLEQKQLQSFLISSEDYSLYDQKTVPMICSTEDGSQFFIYFNSPTNPALAHYIDINDLLHYSTPLTSYLPSFTRLGSAPLFYEQLLYLHVDSIGIMILDPAAGSLVAQYPFNDPIHSFTIYDNALIVAQPSAIGTGGGVDVTAYLLNLETKQSVLLYHNSETYSPFINHMEMSQNGQYLLIEQLPSEYRNQKQLIQLSFN